MVTHRGAGSTTWINVPPVARVFGGNERFETSLIKNLQNNRYENEI
jgi:hypothetical protein